MLEGLQPEHLMPAARCREILEAADIHPTDEKVEIFAQDAFNAVGVLALDLFFKSHDWTRKPADAIRLDFPDHKTDEQINRTIDAQEGQSGSVRPIYQNA